MAKFRKKPVVIEAFRLNERGLIAEDWFWDAVTRNDIVTHCFGKHEPDPAWCEIKTLEGTMIANAGDYIIQGVHGEIYPCKADIFQKIYTEDKPKTNAGVTAQEWISVKDRLPEIPEGCAENPEPVLYMMKNTKTIYAGYYGEGDVWRDRYFRQYADSRNGVDADDVLCWMYQHDLPNPPKGE